MRNDLFQVHIRKRRFISKLICEGIVGGGCRGISALCTGTCKAVEFIGKGLCNILDVAVGFLKVVETTCGWVSAAIQYVLTQLFRVHSIEFEFGLELYKGGVFKSLIFHAAIDLTIFGKRVYLGFGFDLVNPVSSIISGGKKGTDWYKGKMNPKDRTDVEGVYDNPNPYGDFDLTEQFKIENVQSEKDEMMGACMYVDNKNKDTLIKTGGCNDTDERQWWQYTVKGQLMNVWSQKCLSTGGSTSGSHAKLANCDPNSDDQSLQCDLAVRTVKRRRANLCLTTGKTTPRGPGSLVHLGSLKCLHVQGGGYGNIADGTRVLLHSGCSESRLEWELKEDGSLIHKLSGKCVRAYNNRVFDGAELALYSSCGGFKFIITKGGSIQHSGSQKCIQPKTETMIPSDGNLMVLRGKCENNDLYNRDRLIYSFVPTKNKVWLEKCTWIDEGRLDQRFEVQDEPVASVCSKYPKNVAQKKQTSQSSTAHDGHSDRAVDGNYDARFSIKSCTHTNEEQDPWWRVDLGQEYIVTDVTIINRASYGERLKNFDVRVGNDGANNLKNPTCHDRVRSVRDGEAVRVTCSPPIPGRYLSVQMFGKGILTMCEVMVYARLGGLSDLCFLDNGGCDQICINKCSYEVECKCLPGYRLAYDGKTCLNVDECKVNNGGCQHNCVDTVGSFYCGCYNGYILKDNSKTDCQDLNECKYVGCEQQCENTAGSYNCKCKKGYKLKADKHSCSDIDECAVNNGDCEHQCHNYIGGYYCACNPGYKLKDDEQHCEEIYCPPLHTPYRGTIQPAVCTEDRANIQGGTQCSYTCGVGFEIVLHSGSTSKRTCDRLTGLWSGTTPYCRPVRCPKVQKPANGGLLPASCSMTDPEFSKRCVFYCNAGYELRGPRYTTCQADKNWSETYPSTCVRVYKNPWITCPVNLDVVLASDQSGVALGAQWSLPESNMDQLAVYPPGLDKNYLFPAGRTIVTWTATNQEGTVRDCVYEINIIDSTPPVVSGCPASFTVSTDYLWQTVTWVEPTFTDNVGVMSVISNKMSGDQFERGTTMKVRYTGSDAAGSLSHCEFIVTVKAKTCIPIPPPINGKAQVFGKYTYFSCNPGYVFNPQPSPSLFYSCYNNEWNLAINGIPTPQNTFPDCVRTGSKMPDGSCAFGSILVNNQCRNCPPGTHYNVSKTCVPCPHRTFQDVDGSGECQYCSNGYSTKNTGSKAQSDCLQQCSPGKYSDNGLEETNSACKACPIASYQPLHGKTTCKFCPSGTTTSGVGSISATDCIAPARVTETVPRTQLTVTEGQSATMDCFIEGSPQPTVTWNKVPASANPPADRVESTPLYSMKMKLIGLEYTISNVALSDAGDYECVATNAANTHAKRITLTVNPLPTKK